MAKEEGAIRKDWGGKLPVALAFPNQYRLGMSNLGVQIVYRLLNERPDVVAERFFLPEGDDLDFYHRSKGPLVSLESQTPLCDFNLAAFSISFENDYPNVLQMLEMGKIPLRSEERGERTLLSWQAALPLFSTRSHWPLLWISFFWAKRNRTWIISLTPSWNLEGTPASGGTCSCIWREMCRVFMHRLSMMWHIRVMEP
jgi:hypothetical protein